MRLQLFIFFLFTQVAILRAQITEIKGVVLDKQGKKPLAFVNIVADDSKTGTISDIDGKFSLKVKGKPCCVKVSYLGYENTEYHIHYSRDRQLIELSPKIFNLQEVVVLPGVNPAHRIIDSVFHNRKKNDPRKLKAFSYISYDKMILTIRSDSIMQKDTTLLDSSELRARKFLEKRNFFLLETVTERKHMSPDLNQENVLATKVSGFRDPVIVFMLSQLQSTSFYNGLIKILDKNYINPISRGSTKKYFFQIEDTTYTDTGDTVFVISFRPLLNTRFDGMKGFLYINTHGWAIQNVKAEPASDTGAIIVHIQQAYKYIQGHWFPFQLNTNIDFRFAVVKVGDTTYPLMAIGKSYIRDVNLQPHLKKRDFGFHEVEITPDAVNKKAKFWQKYRVDSLSARDKETYRFMDSIGKAANFDKIASVVTTLMNGKIPVKFINIDIDKFIHYNRYEGLYIGLGAHTNQLLSKRFTAGGFWGYGFRDKSAKYGMDFNVIIHKRSETSLHLAVYRQVLPSGGVFFGNEQARIWNSNDFYTLYFKRMNKTKGANASLSFRMRRMRDFKWDLGFRVQNKKTFDNYYFETLSGEKITDFNFSEAHFGFRFAFREKMIQTTKGYISMGSNYPVVYFRYTHGFNGLLQGGFTFDRFDLKIEHKLYIKYLGEFSYQITAGIISGKLPACNLFDGKGSYSPFSLYAPNSFSTMRPNEFLSDKYVALFLTHNFGNLLFKEGKLFNPQLMLVTNIAFGSLSYKNLHHNFDFNTLEKGYYESGIIIRKLLDFKVYDLGIGVMYRYGPYGFDKSANNFAYKISLFYGF